jgi:hypothetical protein
MKINLIPPKLNNFKYITSKKLSNVIFSNLIFSTLINIGYYFL